LAGQVRAAVRARGGAALAVSGGSTAPALFADLLEEDVPWDAVSIWQVDERVVPDGDPRRNSLQLGAIPAQVFEMPVTQRDLTEAARRYERTLPDRFDVVHLGVGDDGHTASWPPGDDTVVESAHAVEVVAEFRGVGRMTLTPRVVNAARNRMVLVLGIAKAPVVGRWLDGDPTLPVAEIRSERTRVFLDPGAAAQSGQ
jgi:6-phosphogluconolactonase/glucosamine-6-phosphate isomerase/deaminase